MAGSQLDDIYGQSIKDHYFCVYDTPFKDANEIPLAAPVEHSRPSHHLYLFIIDAA
jgi:hypothetical protein